MEAKSFDDLRSEYCDSVAKLRSIPTGTVEFLNVTQRVKELDLQLREMESSVGMWTRPIGNYDNGLV